MQDRGVFVTWSFFREKTLTISEKFILIEIQNLTTLKLGCIANNNHFSELMGIKNEAVSRLIGGLVKKGYIDTKIENGSRNFNRVITLNKMLFDLNKMLFDPKQNVISPLTNCYETKGNKTINKTINKADTLFFTKIIAHLNKLTNKNYSSSSKETTRLITARLKEKYTLEDFLNVIDTKVAEWLEDEKMSKYLRPETLFGNKFDKYLNETQEVLSVAQRFG